MSFNTISLIRFDTGKFFYWQSFQTILKQALINLAAFNVTLLIKCVLFKSIEIK